MAKTRKNRSNKLKGGSWWGYVRGVDNNLVTLSGPKGGINCSICSNNTFQFRNGTLDKSKTEQVLFSFLSNQTQLDNISLNCYFCNTCGTAIFVRDFKTAEGSTTYPSLVKYTAATLASNPNPSQM
jgi:hypothetical protein